MGKRIIAVVDVLDAAKAGSKTIPALPGECIVTAGAREKAAELGIIIADGCEAPQPTMPAAAVPRPVESETVIREVCTLLKSRMASGVEPGKLEHLVREVVSARLAGPAAVFPATADPSVSRVEGVCFISGSRLLTAAPARFPWPKKPWCPRLSAAGRITSSPAVTWNGRRPPSAGLLSFLKSAS